MKAIAIKVKGYAGGVSIVNNNNMEKRILHTLFLSLALLAVVYVVLLGAMVFNIVERKTTEVSARALSNQVSDLELQYLSLSNKIDLTLSHSLGFTETKATYATRKSLGSVGSIKLSKNEI